jgi:hypothetical protein
MIGYRSSAIGAEVEFIGLDISERPLAWCEDKVAIQNLGSTGFYEAAFVNHLCLIPFLGQVRANRDRRPHEGDASCVPDQHVSAANLPSIQAEGGSRRKHAACLSLRHDRWAKPRVDGIRGSRR